MTSSQTSDWSPRPQNFRGSVACPNTGFLNTHTRPRRDVSILKKRSGRKVLGSIRVGGLPPPGQTKSYRTSEIAAGVETFEKLPERSKPHAESLRLDDQMKPLLLLALYSDRFFEIPLVLMSEPTWRIHRIRSERIRRPFSYRVSSREWSKFAQFIRRCDVAFETGTKETGTNRSEVREAVSSWRPLVVAANHYLRATFAGGDMPPQWVHNYPWFRLVRKFPDSLRGELPRTTAVREDVLLRYVMCLEALLSGDSREAVGEKIAARTALLTGRNDNERMWIGSFVKKAYGVRSDLVHGRTPKRDVDLRTLRALCQRVLSIVLFLVWKHDRSKEVADLLDDLLLSNGQQRLVRDSRDEVFSLIADPAELNRPQVRDDLTIGTDYRA